ncbi:MAG: heme-binding protein [Coriobacteriales bacterium]|nr:heme-binding protein [Coriobacteriales bacterium]
MLLEQERVLRYESFDAVRALELGTIAARLAPEYDETYTVTITRESDAATWFQWLADDKGERNLMFAAGKRNATVAAGHASPWPQLEVLANGRSLDEVWAKVPDEVASCGAFPIRVGDEWVATLAVSGLHNGLDHEVVLRSLEQALGKKAPRWDADVA